MKLSGIDSGPLTTAQAPSSKRSPVHVGTRLFVGEPEDMPSEPLLNCVREIVKRSLSVSAAYAFMLAVGESNPSFSIGIYFDSPPSSHQVNQLFSKIGYYMRPFLGATGYVDLLALDSNKVLGFAVKQTVQPFYRRRVQ